MSRKYKYFLYAIAAILIAEALLIYINRDQFDFTWWKSPSPQSIEIAKTDPYFDLLNQGKEYLADDNVASATMSFDAAIALNPERPDGYTFKSSLATSTGEQMRLLNLSIAKDPNYGYAYDFRADIYFNQRKFKLSLADIEKALKIGVFTYNLYLNRTSDYLNLKDYANALNSSQEALQVDPNNSKAMLMRGFALLGLGLCGEASDSFDQAVDMSLGGVQEVQMRDTFLYMVNDAKCIDEYQDSDQGQPVPTSTPTSDPGSGTEV